MVKGDERYAFADCAIIFEPTGRSIVDIAYQTVKTARVFDIDPKEQCLVIQH